MMSSEQIALDSSKVVTNPNQAVDATKLFGSIDSFLTRTKEVIPDEEDTEEEEDVICTTTTSP